MRKRVDPIARTMAFNRRQTSTRVVQDKAQAINTNKPKRRLEMHGTANMIKTKARRQPKDKRQKVRVHRYVRKAQRNVKRYMQSVRS